MNFDCAALWVRNRRDLTDALDVTPEFLRSKQHDAGELLGIVRLCSMKAMKLISLSQDSSLITATGTSVSDVDSVLSRSGSCSEAMAFKASRRTYGRFVSFCDAVLSIQ